jgi:hypothetical protein
VPDFSPRSDSTKARSTVTFFGTATPAVHVLQADDGLGAMLLERCHSGTPLRSLPEPEQDLVIAGLLRRFWRAPQSPHPFRPLSMLLNHWSEETLADIERWPDTGLVREGLRLFQELPRTASAESLAGNRRARGQRSSLATRAVARHRPQAIPRRSRLRCDPHGTIHHIADLLELDRERVRLWTFPVPRPGRATIGMISKQSPLPEASRHNPSHEHFIYLLLTFNNLGVTPPTSPLTVVHDSYRRGRAT